MMLDENMVTQLLSFAADALPDVVLAKTLTRCQQLDLSVQNVSAQYYYFIDGTLTSSQQTLLTSLLHLQAEQSVSQRVVVVPRIGTISPWSTKATDILHICGLSTVKRIERGISYGVQTKQPLTPTQLSAVADLLHDRMTESVLFNVEEAEQLFARHAPQPLTTIDIQQQGRAALVEADQHYGLALSDDEIDYLWQHYQALQRNPTDAELMMFAQVNSEHCRHKIFNADWIIDGSALPKTLFQMIKNTHQQNPQGDLSAYCDNGAVIAGSTVARFWVDSAGQYAYHNEATHTVIKVETHNHPTAIAPFPGAATGSGGEIRDEGATGRGAKPKAGLVGFSVSHLHIPEFTQPWDIDYGKPAHIASALDIMLQAPIGAASFNNEFGRPNICGYFRSFSQQQDNDVRGYHKPIMIAGGLGNIREADIIKEKFPDTAKIIVLGGPAMAIGLGGGAASSLHAGESSVELDFASVQRSNPEMQRRCQEVIDGCWSLAADNPILSIHDVGAGGLSNAIPELIEGGGCGGRFELRAIPNDEPGMSPLAIWCNESQERYVLAVMEQQLDAFVAIAERERCPYAVLGEVTAEKELVVTDQQFNQDVVDLPLQMLLGKPPKMTRDVKRLSFTGSSLDTTAIELSEAIKRVLQFPCVASKNFLITIGDRTVGGMVARDQLVGPWQVPVADVAVMTNSFNGYTGEAMAMGERPPLALLHPAAAARMAIGEAITNIAAAAIKHISDIKLSANWMAAAGHAGEDAALYDAVKAVGMELCPALGISIPVGKDSMSMRMQWQQDGQQKTVTAPLSLIISAFAAVTDVRNTLTPQLRSDSAESELWLIDLGRGRNALGGSVLAQVYQQLGAVAPDVDDAALLKNFFQTIQQLRQDNLLLAYHDRSDGGLWATLCEMAFAGHVGVTVSIDDSDNLLAQLFSEELGAVIQINSADREKVNAVAKQFGIDHCLHHVAVLNSDDTIVVQQHGKIIFSESRMSLQRYWAETSYRMQALRDHPDCAQQEFDSLLDDKDPGLNVQLSFDCDEDIVAPYIAKGIKPKIALLREQGVNGQLEMAAAFDRAGFTAIDVHMTDILSGRHRLAEFVGMVACGGFSYGDVLGAGRGWASSILYNPGARDQFTEFFNRDDTFSLGVCNGCQMLSALKELIPGSDLWPTFVRNTSQQFEARLSVVKIAESPSIFFKGMEGSQLPIAVSHGEGRAEFAEGQQQRAVADGLIAVHYVDNRGAVTEQYPANPNGSPAGIGGLTTADGRVTIMMPHPERVFRTVQCSWHPDEWGEDSPWMRMFRNARVWVG